MIAEVADDCLQSVISFRVLESLTAPRERSASLRAGGRVACRIEMTVTVTLPDGKALELEDGATGADAAAAIGPGLARAALAIEVALRSRRTGEAPGELRDLARALPDGRADRDRHGEGRGAGAGADQARRRARAGGGGDGAVAGREDLDRAGDRERLLLRLRVSRRGRRSPRRTSRRSKRRCEST